MAANRTMITASWSLQRADHGEQPFWGVILLASCLGQIGLPGGGFGFGYGSATGIAEPPLAFHSPTMEILANPLGRAIPAARISECLLHPGKSYDFNGRKSTYPDIKLVYWAGGNPFHHHQDTNKLRAGFRRPETIIVHEPWWTATARHADIVLPATTTLERNDFGGAARDRFVVAMQQAIEPVGEARSDYTIFSALAHKLGCESEYTQGRDEMAWLRHIYDGWRDGIRTNQAAIPDFDQFWADGYLEIPQRAEEYVLHADFRADPDKHKLGTPSGRIELYSEKIAGFGYDNCPPHATWIEPSEWLAARPWTIRCISSPASRAIACTARWTQVPSARAARWPAARRLPSIPRCPEARDQRRRCGADLQFARRLPRRRGRDRYDVARGREALVRGLVRSGRRRGRRGLRPW